MLFDLVDVVFLCLLFLLLGVSGGYWFGYRLGARLLRMNIRYMIAGLIKRDVQ